MESPMSSSTQSRQSGWRGMAPILALALLAACSGGGGCSGCGGMGFAPIKGGFPVDKRQENALALRLTRGLFDFISQSGPGLVSQFLPNGEVSIPSTCGGDTEICCGQMCKLKLDVTAINFTPQPPTTTRVTLRSKLRTVSDMKVKIKQGIIKLDCTVRLDSARSGRPDIGVAVSLNSKVNQATRLTSIDIDGNSIDVQDIENGDININGGFVCEVVDFLKGLFIGTLKDQLKKQLAGPLDGALCQSCKSNDECSSLANQGCMGGRCMRDGACMQQLGAEGRLATGSLLGSLSAAGKDASVDVYAVAGGYADVEASGGLSLGMLGGSQTVSRSACVPERPAPAAVALPKPASLTGNTTPNGKNFHAGIGISTMELDTVAHSFYSSGGLCITVGTPQVALLSSGTLTAIVRSLEDLTRGQPASVFIVMRPQQAPTFTLGKGTYKNDGGKKVLDDPLLKVGVKDFALDFYLYLDDRYVRFMRLTADLNLPLGLDVDNMNQLVPILGDLGQALANIRVTDSVLLKEDPAVLSALFPKLLPVLLGQVATSLKPIALPNFMNFSLKPVQITSLEARPGKLDLLGLFFELGVAPMTLVDGQASPGSAVETTAELALLEVPEGERFVLGAGPRAVLRVDGRGSGSLEYQYAVDGGMWRTFDDRHELIVDDAVLGLPGHHYVDVRGRVVGAPETLDPTPARVEFDVRAPRSWTAQGFYGRLPGEAGGGCSSCSATGARTPSGAGWLAALLGAGLFLSRRRLRSQGSSVPARWLALLALPAATQMGACANNKVDEPKAGPGEQFADSDEIGRYQSAVGRGGKIFISAYNTTWGDLAFASISSVDEKIGWRVVDGLPEGGPTDDTPNAPRKGQTDPGPDVGRYTSLGFNSDGSPVIAYQDATAGAVKLAVGSAEGWKVSVVDTPPEGVVLGQFTQLSIGNDDVPAVAYMSVGVRKEGGKLASQLVVAQASGKAPAGPDAWTKKVVEEVEIPCAGLCGAGQACVAVGEKKDPQPSVCKAVGSGCMSCGMGQACVESKCQAVLTAPAAGIPEGTGLYARLLRRGGGDLVVVFHNRQTGALKYASGPELTVQPIDGGDGKVDVGQHLGAAISEDGTLHVAYVDAVRDRLLYRAIKDGPGSMPGALEVIDDGTRGSGAARESHAVGAGATLFIDGGAPRVAYQDQTANTLELATRGGNGWTLETKAGGGGKSRGYYPQAVQLDGKWVLLDVTYDRARETPLSAVEISPL